MKRESTAAAGIVVILSVLFFAPIWGFQLLVVTAATLALFEICQISLRRHTTGVIWFSIPIAWLWLAAIYFGWDLIFPLIGMVFVPSLLVLLSRGTMTRRFNSHLLLALIPILIGIPAGYLLLLRSHFGNRQGIISILFLLVLVWVGDSAAYYVGKNLGKRKISPQVSPNKTVEGTLALVIASTILVVVWALIFEKEIPLAIAAAGGFVIGITAFFGDLIQSLWKRTFEVKDSGTLFPGHGGVWDRTDSLFWVAVPLYYLLTFQ